MKFEAKGTLSSIILTHPGGAKAGAADQSCGRVSRLRERSEPRCRYLRRSNVAVEDTAVSVMEAVAVRCRFATPLPDRSRSERGEKIMRVHVLKYARWLLLDSRFSLGLSAVFSPQIPIGRRSKQALGKSGQLQAGDVFRIGMPRTDLSVTVKGVPVRPLRARSYAAFKQIGDQAMVMGDSCSSTRKSQRDGRPLQRRARGDRSAQPPE